MAGTQVTSPLLLTTASCIVLGVTIFTSRLPDQQISIERLAYTLIIRPNCQFWWKWQGTLNGKQVGLRRSTVKGSYVPICPFRHAFFAVVCIVYHKTHQKQVEENANVSFLRQTIRRAPVVFCYSLTSSTLDTNA